MEARHASRTFTSVTSPASEVRTWCWTCRPSCPSPPCAASQDKPQCHYKCEAMGLPEQTWNRLCNNYLHTRADPANKEQNRTGQGQRDGVNVEMQNGKIWQSERALRPVDQIRHAVKDLGSLWKLLTPNNSCNYREDASNLLKADHEALQYNVIFSWADIAGSPA